MFLSKLVGCSNWRRFDWGYLVRYIFNNNRTAVMGYKMFTRFVFDPVCLSQSKFLPNCGDTHIISCARDGHVRLAEMSSTGVCKNTRKLAQHRGSVHKVSEL